MVNVLHITDPHLFAGRDGELRGTATFATLSRVLDHYRSSAWQADCVALTGDLVQDDSREAYRHFPALLGDLGIPVLCVPGNHDVRSFMREALSSPPFRYGGEVTAGNWRILGIDSCKQGSASGRVGDAELERLSAALEAPGAEHLLVCLHHPPLAVDSKWLEEVGLENRDRLLAMLHAAGTVRGILFGHIHQAVDRQVRGIRIIGTPSTCRQFRPGADSFALDDKPPAYRRVGLQPDGRIESELVWVDAQGSGRAA